MIELPIQNFPKQQSIFDSKARVKLAAKGRRFGLTKGAANDFITAALKREFTKGLWVDVVNSNIDKYIERYFIPELKRLPEHLWQWRKQAKIVTINGAYIDFRSADTPETMEGFGYDKAFINEAGIVLRDEYLWNNAIQPMFWDYPNASIVIGGTPKGKGKFFELCERGKDPAQKQYDFFTFTSFDNPFISHDVIKQDMESMPQRVIDQEIYAKFLDDTGIVFRGFMDIMDASPNGPIPGHVYVMGVDVAKVQDFTVLAIYDTINNKQVYQARFNKLDWPMQRQRIQSTAKHYNNASIVIDATGVGDPIADDLARFSLPVDPIKFTNDQKRMMVEKLANWIELKRVHMINIPETVREFTNFTYDISEQTGRVIYNAPVGFNDDIVWAHALAVWRLIPKTKQKKEEAQTITQYAKHKAYEDQYADIAEIRTDDFNEWSEYQ